MPRLPERMLWTVTAWATIPAFGLLLAVEWIGGLAIPLGMTAAPLVAFQVGPRAWPCRSPERCAAEGLAAGALAAFVAFLGALSFFAGAPSGPIADVYSPLAALGVYALGALVAAWRAGRSGWFWPLWTGLSVIVLFAGIHLAGHLGEPYEA